MDKEKCFYTKTHDFIPQYQKAKQLSTENDLLRLIVNAVKFV